jgi:hypothetical protein
MGSGRRRGRRALPSGTSALALGALLVSGFVTAVVGVGPDGTGGSPGPGRLVGGAMVTFALLALAVFGIAGRTGRSAGHATRVRAAPPPAPLPEPIAERGWTGWRFRIGHATHEVWVPDDVTDTRLLCDGRWIEPDWQVPWSGHVEEGSFTVGRHPARLILRLHRAGDAPDPRGVTDSVERGELLVDGVPRPERERVTADRAAPVIRLDEPAIHRPPRSSRSR